MRAALLNPLSNTFSPRRRGAKSVPTFIHRLGLARNWPVLAAMAVLCALGLLTIWYRGEGLRQVYFLGIGIVAMVLFQAVNYQKIGRWSWPFYFFSLMLLVYTIVGAALADPVSGKSILPGIQRRNGAFNWISIGTFTLQPAELMKLAFIMVLARYLRFRSNYRTIKGLLAPFALAGAPMLIILKQPDLGTALTFIPCLLAMLFVAGAKIKHLLLIIGCGLFAGVFLWLCGTDRPFFRHLPDLVKDYQRSRVYAMFSDDPRMLRKEGFQQRMALMAFGSGGWAGRGMGNIPVGKSVPEGHNDMVFALIGEQFGFFGSAIVLFAYIVLYTAGVEISSSTRDPFGRLVALGIVAMMAGQTFLNLLVAVKLFPVTGVTLPFISYGGSSLLASFLSVGLLLNIGQNKPIVMANDSFEYD